ncbi:hypothetical protein Tco_0498451, partial [Tanacetum coccineum]
TLNLEVGAEKRALFQSGMFASGISSLCVVDGSNKGGDGISDGWWVDGDAALNRIPTAL